MSFEGVIEAFGRETISGWASYVSNGERTRPEISLHFNTLGIFQPTEVIIREGGRTGFRFNLPASFSTIEWQAFLNDFDAVIAKSIEPPDGSSFRVPFFKSVFNNFDVDNRTSLRAGILKQYAMKPNLGSKLAAFTIVYNEHAILPLWARYYADHFGAENLYVIDQGSVEPAYAPLLPAGVNIVRVPRESFDNWLIARLVAIFQRFLLESYDVVLYSDSDEFVCVDPAALRGQSFPSFLKSIRELVGITTGYNLVHNINTEKAYDAARPLLAQRQFLHRMTTMDKPLISRIPLNWVPGFHQAVEGGVKIDGLYMVHLRWFDLNFALKKGGYYRESAWNAYDVQHRLADYQRDGETEIISRFRSLSEQVSRLKDAQFDPSSDFTVVPEWMREAIYI